MDYRQEIQNHILEKKFLRGMDLCDQALVHSELNKGEIYHAGAICAFEERLYFSAYQWSMASYKYLRSDVGYLIGFKACKALIQEDYVDAKAMTFALYKDFVDNVSTMIATKEYSKILFQEIMGILPLVGLEASIPFYQELIENSL